MPLWTSLPSWSYVGKKTSKSVWPERSLPRASSIVLNEDTWTLALYFLYAFSNALTVSALM
jgi:hypothetical protein